jgi:hypothetical protein
MSRASTRTLLPCSNDPVVDPEQVGGPVAVLLAECLGQLRGRPRVGEALHPVGVRVQRGGQPAGRRGQIPEQELRGLVGDPAGQRVVGQPPQLGVDPQQQGVVIEHLLEMRHGPGVVHRIPGKAAGKLVVDAATGHLLAGVPDDLERLGVAGPLVVPQQKEQIHVRRELRRAPESAVPRIVLLTELGQRGVEQRRRDRGGRPADQLRAADGLDHRGALLEHVRPLVGPRRADRGEQPPEIRLRKVRAAEERFTIGRGEDGHRPAALPGHRLRGGHVDGIHIGPLLAVHLDRDKAVIDQRGNRRILERLMRHDVTPVTTRVSDRDQNRDISPPRLLERLSAPWPPVHRILGMLEQIRRGHSTQSVHMDQALTSGSADIKIRTPPSRPPDLYAYSTHGPSRGEGGSSGL